MIKGFFSAIIDLIVSFIGGVSVGIIIVFAQSFFYKIKFGIDEFQFAVGHGRTVDLWNVIDINQVLFICLCFGAVVVLMDLVFLIMKAILKK